MNFDQITVKLRVAIASVNDGTRDKDTLCEPENVKLVRELEAAAHQMSAGPLELARANYEVGWYYYLLQEGLDGAAAETQFEASMRHLLNSIILYNDKVPPEALPLEMKLWMTEGTLPQGWRREAFLVAQDANDNGLAESVSSKAWHARHAQMLRFAASSERMSAPASRCEKRLALASCLRLIAARFKELSAAHEAIEVLEGLLTVPAQWDKVTQGIISNNLANAYKVAFDLSGQQNAIATAWRHATHAELALRGTGLDTTAVSTLGFVGATFYAAQPDEDVLRHSLLSCREAYDGILKHAKQEPLAARFLVTLSHLCSWSYLSWGDRADIDAALAHAQSAARLSVLPFDRAMSLRTLAVRLMNRFDVYREFPDLKEALKCQEAAFDVLKGADIQDPHAISDNADVLRALAELMHDGDLARIAADRAQTAVHLTSVTDAQALITYETAARCHMTVYDLEDDVAALKKCVDFGRRAVVESGSSHTLQARQYGHLANSLLTLFRKEGDDGLLTEMVEMGEAAVAASTALSAESVDYLLNAAIYRRERHNASPGSDDLTVAKEYCDEALRTTKGSAQSRYAAAVIGAELAGGEEGGERALEYYAKAISLLSDLAWRGLSPNGRIQALENRTDVVSSAVALAIKLGDDLKALSLIEEGTQQIWRQDSQLHLDITRIREIDHDFAEELEFVQNRLLRIDTQKVMPNGQLDGEGPSDGIGAIRRVMSARWEKLKASALLRPELSPFFSPPDPRELLNQLGDRVVALVIAAENDGYALLIREGRPQSLPLPGFSRSELAARLQELHEAKQIVTESEGTGDSFPALVRASKLVEDVLHWTWMTASAPVFRELGWVQGNQVIVGGERRLWWCPIGPAVSLPLHAAQPQALGEAAGALDACVSSYVTAVSRFAVSHDAEAPMPGLVGCAVARGAAPLEFVEMELRAVAGVIGSEEESLNVTATVEEFFTVLERSPSIHVACHAAYDGHLPPRLLMSDGDASLAEIAEHRPPHGQFAYVSACDTAAGLLHAPDEHLSLAAGFQAMGYSSVVASLWQVVDSTAPRVAERLYEGIVCEDGLSVFRSGPELNAATRELREQCWDLPFLWAPYVHFGF